MAQKLKTFAVLVKDQGLVPNIFMPAFHPEALGDMSVKVIVLLGGACPEIGVFAVIPENLNNFPNLCV